MASNVDILTRAHTALKAKARARKNQVDSVVFDDEARVEFLTGFRKRKLQKKEAAKSKAKERERQERLQARKEQRQALRIKALENVRQIESALKQGDNDNEADDEETDRFSPSRKGKEKATQEFEDEEQLATVTIVEEFDPDTLLHVSSRTRSVPSSSPSESETRADWRSRVRNPRDEDGVTQLGLDVDQMAKLSPRKARVQPKGVVYETKSARKAARVKQLSRKLEKANLASGKARRKGKR